MVQLVIRQAVKENGVLVKDAFKISHEDIEIVINERHGNPTFYLKSGAVFKADRHLGSVLSDFSKALSARKSLLEVHVLHPDGGAMDKRSLESFVPGLMPTR